MTARTIAAVVTAAALLAQPSSAAPQRSEHAQHANTPPLPPPNPTPQRPQATPPATPAPPPETRAYDPQLMRLAEILGALAYLRGLCGAGDADHWRQRMQTLLDAEGSPAARKERLAGAYNRGVAGYSLSYRTCTPNARLVIERFLREGTAIAKEVENRYRAS